MNFIEIVRSVRILSGTQGTGPASVSTASGYEEALVQFVRDAWIDIQNYREDFDFMHREISFNTTQGKDTYVLDDIFPSNSEIHKRWAKNSATLEDHVTLRKTILTYRDPEYIHFKYLNTTTQNKPIEYTVTPENNSILLKGTPNDTYSIRLHYYRNPQILLNDADVPLIGPAYHNLIVYRALQKMSVFLSAPEVFRNYSTEADKMQGQLMRSEVPGKKMKKVRVFA